MKKFLEVKCARCGFSAAWLSPSLGKDSRNASIHYPFHSVCGKCKAGLKINYHVVHVLAFAAAILGPLTFSVASNLDVPNNLFYMAMAFLFAAPVLFLVWALFNVSMVVETEPLQKNEKSPLEPEPVATLS